jgi:hypothetical protein
MRTLRTPLASAAALALTLALAPATAAPPRPSPAAAVEQTVGVTKLAIRYSSPGVKGRQIWGALVPYEQVWRTGANEATTFTASTDVMVEGKPLPAGTYALFTIPRADRWTVVFNKRGEQWGAFDRAAEEDALQVDVKPQEATMRERLAFSFADATDTSVVVKLHWEKVAVPFTVTVDTPRLALEQARRELAAADASPGAHGQWARWAHEQNLAPEEAVAWAARSVTGDGAKSFPRAAIHARLLARAGKTAEARAEATRALTLVDEGNAGMVEDAAKLRAELAAWGG